MPNERARDNRSGPRGGPRKPRKGAGGKGGAGKGAARSGGDSKGRAAPRSPRDGDRRPPGPDLVGPAEWGRIARGGAGRMESPAIGTESYDDFPAKRPRRRPSTPSDDAVDAGTTAAEPTADDARAGGDAVVERTRPPKPERSLPGAADLERQGAKAVQRSRGRAQRERKPLGARPQRAEDPTVVLRRLVGPDRAKSLGRKLNDAGRAFQAERFGDARALLRPVVKEAPTLPDGRELMGLSLYRLGRWKEAIDQLELFRELTDSTEQHPVLADCHRALGRVHDVEFLWQELGAASPSSEVVTEGRIVLAGTYADQGDLAKAIRTLEAGWKPPKRPGDQHLRRAYALADLYDRAGKTARARELFKWIAGHQPRFADVTTRVKQLS